MWEVCRCCFLSEAHSVLEAIDIELEFGMSFLLICLQSVCTFLLLFLHPTFHRPPPNGNPILTHSPFPSGLYMAVYTARQYDTYRLQACILCCTGSVLEIGHDVEVQPLHPAARSHMPIGLPVWVYDLLKSCDCEKLRILRYQLQVAKYIVLPVYTVVLAVNTFSFLPHELSVTGLAE